MDIMTQSEDPEKMTFSYMSPNVHIQSQGILMATCLKILDQVDNLPDLQTISHAKEREPEITLRTYGYMILINFLRREEIDLSYL